MNSNIADLKIQGTQAVFSAWTKIHLTCILVCIRIIKSCILKLSSYSKHKQAFACPSIYLFPQNLLFHVSAVNICVHSSWEHYLTGSNTISSDFIQWNLQIKDT